MSSLKDRINLNHTVYILSHNFLNDIISLRGLMGLVKDKHLDMWDKDDLENFHLIANTIDAYETTINHLLDYSRISTRGAPSELITVKDLANRAKEELALSGSNPTELECNCIGKLKLDINQFIFAFKCIFNNSIKYSDTSPTKIKITCSRDTTWYTLYIEDNGPGIPIELEGKVFMMFQPGKHSNSGLGLGLACVKKIVERHKGEVNYNFEKKRIEIFLPVNLYLE